MMVDNNEVPPTTLTVEQTSRTLGLSRSTVCKFITDGKLPSFVMGGRRLIEYSDIQKLIAAHRGSQDSRAEFRAKRAKQGVEVRSKRRGSPSGVKAVA